MPVLRRGIVSLTVLVGFGLAATVALADGTSPNYYDKPWLWRGLYGGVNVGHADADGDNGVVGGVQLGYNWQSNQIVYGVEGDISFSGEHSIDWLASARGRLGYLIQPRVLVYGTAGLGLVNGSGTPVNSGGTDAGFVWGLGVEGKINPTMSARLEYLSFNTDSTRAHADTVDVIRAGLNIKLGRCWLGALC
jgi:opacity protein-like surface antigen